MAKDIYQQFLEECAAKGRELGLIVRCESHGVLAMVHPKHATEAEKQPALPLPIVANGMDEGQRTQIHATTRDNL